MRMNVYVPLFVTVRDRERDCDGGEDERLLLLMLPLTCLMHQDSRTLASRLRLCLSFFSPILAACHTHLSFPLK